MRYEVRPIADADCSSLTYEVLMDTDNLTAAKWAAERVNYPFGIGIKDTATGQIDVGFGFGVPCPEQPT